MSNYLVTGCAGFIASHVIRLLLEQGHHVTGIDDLSDGYDSRLKQWRLNKLTNVEFFRFFRIDLRDLNDLGDMFTNRYDAVINLGARAGVRQSIEDPWIYTETNYIGTLNLLELCKEYEIPKFVLASTSSVYGNDTPPPFSENAPTNAPLSPYAASKKAAENLGYTYHYLYGIDTTVFRFFTVYGPAGRPDMSVFKFIKAIAEDKPLILFGDGGSRDFTHVNDIADGVVKGLKLVGYEVINLGSDNPVRTTHIISLIEQTLGKTANIIEAPRPVVDVDATWANISKARRLLGWNPHTNLEYGIRNAVEWYLSNRDWAKNLSD